MTSLLLLYTLNFRFEFRSHGLIFGIAADMLNILEQSLHHSVHLSEKGMVIPSNVITGLVNLMKLMYNINHMKPDVKTL